MRHWFKQRTTNGSLSENERNHAFDFSNSEYKTLPSEDFQSLAVKMMIALNFKKLDYLQAYYQQQVVSFYFLGRFWHGSSFDVLDAGTKQAGWSDKK